MMKVLVLITVVLSQQVFAKHYYRFWRGHRAPQMQKVDFVKGLNKIFIPETVEQGRGHGLIAYMPVLINSTHLPEEMALVVYESEEKYRSIRKMPRGSNYQKMHWDYFNKSNSRSKVPEKFLGQIQLEYAYDLLESKANWQKGDVYFVVRATNEKKLSKLSSYFALVKRGNNLSHLVLVGKKAVYEYVLVKKGRSFNPLEINGFKLLKKIKFKNNNENITWDEGVNRQFSLSLK